VLAKKKWIIACALLTVFSAGCGSGKSAETGVMKSKPSAPLSVKIEPDSDELEPGQVVDFRITVSSPVPIPRLELSVDVPDTLAVFSGDRQWAGPLPAGQRQELVLAIRIPDSRGNHITANAVAYFEGGQSMAAQDVYVFGQTPRERTSPEGRDTTREGERIKEYRLP